MSKRIVCVLLALILLVGLVPAGVISASAASNRTVSENAVKFIKAWEGYSKNAYWDNSQYSYGYGTVAPNGLATISEADADKALREELKTIDAKVNNFAATHGKNFSQQQHDALVSFSYNVGYGWMSQTSYRITKAVINGAKGNEFLQAMTLWSNVDSIPQAGLVSRRMAEADMYLNGSYDKAARASYTYVKFDANGGTLGEDKVQAYDYNTAVTITSKPTREGYTFLGWYTKTSEGEWVSVLNKSTAGTTLYAKWQKDSSVVENGKVVGTAASYTIKGTQLASLNVYSVPNTNTNAVATVKSSDSFKITAEYVDADGAKWVKISSGWVKLGVITTNTGSSSSSSAATTNVVVNVTNAYINVRPEPGTDPTNAPTGKVNYGDKLTITEVEEVNGALWGKFERGWVALMYTDYNTASAGTDSSDLGSVIATGTVTVTNTNLNVRTAAGTTNALVGSLANNTKVNIYAIEDVDGHKWGQIGSGRWVCLDYVVYKNVESTGTSTPITTVQPTGDPFLFKATVNTNGLNIYNKAAISGATPVGSLAKNANVSVLELVSVNSTLFGKIKHNGVTGWIQLQHTIYTATGVVDTMQGGDLNVRVGWGTGYAVAQENGKDVKLKNGSAVTILEMKVNGTSVWGRVKEGWIAIEHVSLNTTTPTVTVTPDSSTSTTVESVIMTGIVNSGINLNVRLGAGMEFDTVNSLANGTKVEIYAKEIVNGHYWGKLGNNAWICLTYVTDTTSITGLPDSSTNSGSTGSTQTTPVEPVMATVYNCSIGVNIRSTPGVNSALVGSASLGERVKVYEQTTHNGSLWGRTDEGWISMLYLKLDGQEDTTGSTTTTVYNGLFQAKVTVNELPIYDSIDGGTAVGTLLKDNTVYVSEIQSSNGTKIVGKVTVDGATGWIDLASTAFSAKGTVNTKEGGTLNVRKTAGSTAAADVVEKLNNGSAITVVELKPIVNGAATVIWGKIAQDKWVSLEHVTLASTSVNTNTSTGTGTSTGTTTTTTTTGTISGAALVNVRGAAGATNALITQLPAGTEVTIHEETIADTAPWCRISTASVNGWVAKQYLTVKTTASTGTGTSAGTGTGTSTGTSTSNYATGYVNSNIPLNIRQLPDVNSAKVGELAKGMTITIYEQQAGGGLTWGRVDKGWVALNYVTITATSSTGNGNMGTVIKAFSTVNVRSAPGTGNAKVGELMVGSRVEILNQQTYNGAIWYQVSNGWVAGEYIELDAPFVSGGTTTPDASTGTGTTTGDNMTNTDTGDQDEVGAQKTTATLNHPTNDVVQYYDTYTAAKTAKTTALNGTTVSISALAGIGTEIWARVAGSEELWFNLDETTGFVAVGTVNTVQGGSLNVRAEAGRTGGDPVTTLANKSSITITDLKVANGHIWGKMSKGWVSLEHLALTASYQGVTSGSSEGDATAEILSAPANSLFTATIKTQHLSINVYDKVDGSAVGILDSNSGSSIGISKIQASSSGIWGKTLTNKGERWIKMTDVDYVVFSATVKVKGYATSSPGGTATMGTEYKGDGTEYVDVSNFIAVGSVIYAQITSDINKDGWLNIESITPWYVAPATTSTESVNSNTASGVLFKTKMAATGGAFEKADSASSVKFYVEKGTEVLVLSVDAVNGWAQIATIITAPDMTTTAATRYVKLVNLLGSISATASTKWDLYIFKAKDDTNTTASGYHEIYKAGTAVTVTALEQDSAGAFWAKLSYTDKDGKAADAYVKAQNLTFNKIS